MGVDWLYRASKTFNRALDRREVALRTPNLVSPKIEIADRIVCGDPVKDSTFKLGEKIMLRVINDRLVAQRENLVVAEFPNPPKDDIQRIRASGCINIGEVRAVNELSGTVEVSIGNG